MIKWVNNLKTNNNDLKKKTYGALFWSFIDRAGEQIIRFVFSIVLARLLLPEHFGLVGMAYVVIEIARIFIQGGFGYALINKANATKTDECSVFYFNLALGIIMVVTIFFFSPVISDFFHAPALTPIIRMLSLDLLIGSLSMIQTVLMTKDINFKAQTKVSLPSTIISGTVGICLAFYHFEVWALVYQSLLRTTLYTILMWFTHKWRPEIRFSLFSLKSLFGFGSKLLLGNVAQVVFNNIYTILIGRIFTPVKLGYFSRAQQTQAVPIDTLSFIIWRVAFPVFSSIKNDGTRMQKALSKASMTIGFFVFPSLMVAAAAAPNLFVVLFGERWIPSIPMFQILCIGSIFAPLEQIRNNAIISKGRPGIQLFLQIVKYASILVSMVILHKYGITALLIGFGIVSYINFIINSFFVKKIIGYDVLQQFKDLFPSLFCALIAGLAAYSIIKVVNGNILLSLIIQVNIFMVIYSLCCYLFRIEAFIEYGSFLIKKIPIFTR